MTITVKEYLETLEKRFSKAGLFFGHGTDNAWDEAVQLVLYALKLPLNSGPDVLTHRVSDQETRIIESLAEKRIKEKIPLPYLTHQAWFAGMSFYVDERVLIPRSPFAELIEQQFSPWIEGDDVKNILEIGTGSGCMSIAAAHAFPEAQIDAVDLYADALAVAAINVKNYQLENQVHLHQGNGFDFLQQSSNSKKYDIIMSNPPYVGKEEMRQLPKEYLHEPQHALEAENEGFAIVDNILSHAAHYLKQGNSILVVEVGNGDEVLTQRYPELPFIWLDLERGGQGIFLLTKDDLKHVRK